MKSLGGQICFTIIPDSLIDSIVETINHIHCENTSQQFPEQNKFSITLCGSASLGKKTAANLELMRKDIQNRLNDINESLEDMKNNNDGNKTTIGALSRAVRGVARTTGWAFHQIEKFQQEWQEKSDCERKPVEWKKTKDGPHNRPRQITEQSTPAVTLPSHKNPDRANTVKKRPISGPIQITPPKNQNNNISHSPTTIQDGRIKNKMLTTVKISP